MAKAESKPSETQGGLDRFFGLSSAGTSITTELRAGLATFLTMAYIMFVNPAILAQTGMDHGAVFVATCLAAALGTAIMGLYANYPLALAPGMGLNAYFAFTMVPELGGNWQLALGVVFVSGVLFFAMSLTPIRAWLVDSIPMPLKLGIAAGIGLFLALIGLQNAGIVTGDPTTLVTLGDFSKPQALLAAAGFLLIAGLAVRKIPGAIIIGVLTVTFIAVVFGLEPWHGIVSAPPSLAPTFLAMSFSGLFKLGTMVMVLALLLVTILDAAGTLIGVARLAGLLDAEGRLPRLRQARRFRRSRSRRSFGHLLHHCLYRKCRWRGGRRPHRPRGDRRCRSVPACAVFRTARPHCAALRPGPGDPLSGLPQGGELGAIHWDDATDYIPALIIALMMPLAYSISTGIGLGFVAYVALKLSSGRFRDINNAAVAIIAAAFLLKLILP